MLPAQRRDEITKHISEVGAVNTETLAKRFGVSVMTARRDLKILEQEKRLRLTWGGAVPLTFLSHEIPYSSKMDHMPKAKEAIAEYAAALVPDRTCILLDAGTTTFALAKKLASRTLTVVTTDLHIAIQLLQSPSVTVHLTGGQLDNDTRSCNDMSVAAFLESINVTMAFIGTNVWDLSRGAGTSNHTRMHIKRKMMERAEKTVLLADSSKYGAFGPWTVAQLSEFSTVITDRGLGESARKSVQGSGVNLRLAE
jgi:Transcriptional regulators of sugar metabolism